MREPQTPVRERRLSAFGASSIAASLRRPRLRGLAIAVAASVFLAVAGAFGTAASPPLPRFAFWLGGMAGGTIIGIAVDQALRRHGRLAANIWLRGSATAILMSIPYTPVVWALGLMIEPHPFGPRLIDSMGPVLAISAIMTAVNLMSPTQAQLVETRADGPSGAPPRFIGRLAPKLDGAELYAVEAEDHYLRIYTSRGTDLVLMRLTDAVRELDGLEGARTHRSWWVARSAVEGARRVGQRTLLRLKSGVEAPVSRSFVRTLRAEGWF
jgi:hypothetical protein